MVIETLMVKLGSALRVGKGGQGVRALSITEGRRMPPHKQHLGLLDDHTGCSGLRFVLAF